MVRVKGMGSGNNCCCGGCRSSPVFEEIVGFAGLQALQQYCCSCIPIQICVQVVCDDGSIYNVLLNFPCPTLPTESPEIFPLLYSGEIFVNDQIVDIGFRLKVIDQQCYLCLESEELSIGSSAGSGPLDSIGEDGLTAGPFGNSVNNCILIDSAKRGCPDLFCCSFIAQWDDIDISGCGTGSASNASISTGVPNTTDLTGDFPATILCPDPDGLIELPSSGEIYCCGCSCVCSQICVTIQDTAPGGTSGIFTLTGGIEPCGQWFWRGSGIVIAIRGKDDDDLESSSSSSQSGSSSSSSSSSGSGCVKPDILTDCEIVLIELPFAFDPDEAPPVDIDSTNPCPNPTANWNLVQTIDDIDYLIAVTMFCEECTECGKIVQADCCSGRPLPRILYVDVNAECAAEPDNCGSFTLPIVWDQVALSWVGTHPTLWCEHDVTISLSCGLTGFEINIVAATCAELHGTVGVESPNSCDPLFLSYSFLDQPNNVGCCDDDISDLFPPNFDIFVQVME